ncbi:hypothetical protein TYRP_018694 [Tyrophagus putrescentiae]|nr:hypothetical protein TYRP_018694 [Tyrophagus putrescentiae]
MTRCPWEYLQVLALEELKRQLPFRLVRQVSSSSSVAASQLAGGIQVQSADGSYTVYQLQYDPNQRSQGSLQTYDPTTTATTINMSDWKTLNDQQQQQNQQNQQTIQLQWAAP